jgi:hypothetical protein
MTRATGILPVQERMAGTAMPREARHEEQFPVPRPSSYAVV